MSGIHACLPETCCRSILRRVQHEYNLRGLRYSGKYGKLAMPDQMETRERLMKLRQEHRDLDDAIARMSEGPFVNELQLKRMKIRKLQIKDFIARLESSLIPDLDA